MNSKIIFIVGLMGSGKTSIGKLLSKKMEKKFFDTDKEIIGQENLTIGQIFKKFGEKYFRELEYKTLSRLKDNIGCIISTGGGIVLKKENIDIMVGSGTIIFLDINVEEQINRIKNKKNRPLLNDQNLENDLLVMKNSRDPIYKSVADYTINVSKKTKNEIVSGIEVYLK
jgi:shikimate kinase